MYRNQYMSVPPSFNVVLQNRKSVFIFVCMNSNVENDAFQILAIPHLKTN